MQRVEGTKAIGCETEAREKLSLRFDNLRSESRRVSETGALLVRIAFQLLRSADWRSNAPCPSYQIKHLLNCFQLQREFVLPLIVGEAVDGAASR